MSLADLKRALYPDNRPGRLASVLNRGWAAVHALGVLPNYLVTLEVRGHKSGELRSLPLVMAVVDGRRHLVSMLGEDVAWVRNVRAAGGRVVLRHGRREPVVLEDVPVERRAPIIKAYLARAPGARAHVPVDRHAPVEDFEAIAGRVPVFEIVE